MRFKNKKVIVTGAASGIGKATAQLYASEGASVYALDINEDGLKELAANPNTTTGRWDVSKYEDCNSAVEAAVEAMSGLDILANVAGIFELHHATDIDEETWTKIIHTNLSGVFWMSQASIPHLLESGGNIVNVTSTAGVKGQAYTVAYCASKGGANLVTYSMAMEYGKSNIRINAIAPGGVETGIAANFSFPEGIDSSLIDRFAYTPRGLASPMDIAEGIAYLSSDAAHRIHGAVIHIDAGATAG